MLVDHTVRGWKAQGRSIADLRFAWWNEPAKGHASGPRVGNLATGDWGEEFHRASSAILVDGGGVNFRGCSCAAPPSPWREGARRARELASVTGGKNGGWWERIDRRAFNSGIYFPRGLPLSKGVGRYKTGDAAAVDIMRALKVPAPRDRVDIHEWYATPGSLDGRTSRTTRRTGARPSPPRLRAGQGRGSGPQAVLLPDQLHGRPAARLAVRAVRRGQQSRPRRPPTMACPGLSGCFAAALRGRRPFPPRRATPGHRKATESPAAEIGGRTRPPRRCSTSGGSTPSTSRGRVLHEEQVREDRLRECSRAQTSCTSDGRSRKNRGSSSSDSAYTG